MPAKILFVDDDPNILAAFQRQLRKDFSVHTALGGEEGLRAVSARDPFAVIVSDLRMPGMDGIQFLSRVRQTAAGQRSNYAYGKCRLINGNRCSEPGKHLQVSDQTMRTAGPV